MGGGQGPFLPQGPVNSRLSTDNEHAASSVLWRVTLELIEWLESLNHSKVFIFAQVWSLYFDWHLPFGWSLSPSPVAEGHRCRPEGQTVTSRWSIGQFLQSLSARQSLQFSPGTKTTLCFGWRLACTHLSSPQTSHFFPSMTSSWTTDLLPGRPVSHDFFWKHM